MKRDSEHPLNILPSSESKMSQFRILIELIKFFQEEKTNDSKLNKTTMDAISSQNIFLKFNIIIFVIFRP